MQKCVEAALSQPLGANCLYELTGARIDPPQALARKLQAVEQAPDARGLVGSQVVVDRRPERRALTDLPREDDARFLTP